MVRASWVHVGPSRWVHFRTGAAPSGGPAPTVEITGASSTGGWDHLEPWCAQAVATQDVCFDTGQDTHVVLHVEGDGEPVYYEVTVRTADGAGVHHRFTWPAACGGPSYFTYGDPAHHGVVAQRCYEVSAVDASGRRSTSAPYCVSPQGLEEPPEREPEVAPGDLACAPDGPDGCGGCSAAPTPPWAVLLVVAGLALRRRRAGAALADLRARPRVARLPHGTLTVQHGPRPRR